MFCRSSIRFLEFDSAKFLTHPFFIRLFVTWFRLLVACKRQIRAKSLLLMHY
jgi:hypothetical protein